jgi:hypothetical protein
LSLLLPWLLDHAQAPLFARPELYKNRLVPPPLQQLKTMTSLDLHPTHPDAALGNSNLGETITSNSHASSLAFVGRHSIDSNLEALEDRIQTKP